MFCNEAHFWLNGYVNKQNYWFRPQAEHRLDQEEDSDVAKAISLPKKVIVWAAISIEEIYVEFFDSPIIKKNYLQLLKTKFFPYAKKTI